MNPTPAIQALLACRNSPWQWAQVVIHRENSGYLLRHVSDRDRPEAELRLVRLAELRRLAQHSASGDYRPLHCAPNLVAGWHARAGSTAELEAALDSLYPGSVADWFAARKEPPPVTHYREFTRRQTGMYRLTAMLSDSQAADVMGAVCAPAGCLKRRLWTVNGQPADAPDHKSDIPCLEPCALLLEVARQAMRIEQQNALPLALRADDAASAIAALEYSLASGLASGRVAEISEPANPYRLRLALAKLRGALAPSQVRNEE